MKKFLLFTILMLTLFVITGCVVTPDNGVVNVSIDDTNESANPADGLTPISGEVITDTDKEENVADKESNEAIEINDKTEEEVKETEVKENTKSSNYKIEVTEGDLVSLKPKAVDPDADSIKYLFSKPLDQDGKWQTETGDAGTYYIDVTATDGKLSATQTVMLVVKSGNKAPTLAQLSDITVSEGQTVRLNPKATDPEGDDISYKISGWMDSLSYKTVKGDEGTHKVTITASDGTNEVSEEIHVIVKKENHAPKITKLAADPVTEKETVTLEAEAEDEDGDDVEFIYPQPFNSDGEWETKEGDAGSYRVVVTATDGEKTDSKEVIIRVNALNSAPVLEPIDDITVNEGDTITLSVKASDPDGDKVTITISGWMTSTTKKTGFDDAGEYTVTVTASDGTLETSQTVDITVKDKNRPPVFVDIVQEE